MARLASTWRGWGTALLGWGLFVASAGASSSALAQARCFDVTETAAAKAEPAARRAGVTRAWLGSEVRVAVGCELSLDPGGGWVAAPEPVEARRFAEWVHAIAARSATALQQLPARLYARRPAAEGAERAAAAEVLELAACSQHLLEAGQGFEVRIPFGSRRIVLRRTTGAGGCGAAALELAARPAAGPGQAPPLAQGPWPIRLPVGEPELSLDPGRWDLYALAPSGAIGARLGQVDSLGTGSALDRLLAARGADAERPEPWLRASWALGRLRLEPLQEADYEGDAWIELRAAAASGQLWVARPSPEAGPAGAAAEIVSPLWVDRGGRALALPADEIRAFMRGRYGDAGASMVPTLDDWARAIEALSLCLAPSYDGAGLQRVGGALPNGARCAPLDTMVVPLEHLLGGPALPTGQLCVKRGLSVMTASGVELEPDGDDACQPLRQAAPGEPLLLAAVGDALLHTGTGSANLFVCEHDACRPLGQAERWTPLERAGLTEIRYAPSLEQASNPDGLTLLRLGVVDPGTEWHPVGLLPTLDAVPNNRWTALDHEEDAVFSYVRGRQQLDLRLSTTPALAAAWNAAPGARNQLQSELPRLERVRGALPGPRPSALVTLVTAEPSCPAQSAQQLWSAIERVEPDALAVGRRFHVHLAEYRSPTEPVRCIARASFVVREHRQLRAAERLRVGLLGDLRMAVFLTAPAALGLALPVGYLKWSWGAGFGLDVSASLTAGVTFDTGALSRAGAGLSAAVYWGPPALVPHLFELGGMLHGATGTHSEQPIGSLYAGINLASLLDALGGR